MLLSAWRLAKPYWLSDEKTVAWTLSVALILLNVAMVYIGVRLNWWRKDLFDALQAYDSHQFYIQVGVFALLSVSWVLVATYQTYLKQMLHIRWRRWLTYEYVHQWLEHKTYYHWQLENRQMDNPDQRIAEDLNLFTQETLSLSLGLLNAMLTLICFLGILWSMSASMLVFALIYAVLGTWASHLIGQRLAMLNFKQQRYEADFRFGLLNLCEHAEQVALYGGERREQNILRTRFESVFENFVALIKRTKTLEYWTYLYAQVTVVFPYLMMAPRFFAQKMQLGEWMQTASAFATVENSLSYVVNSYASIMSLQAVIQRIELLHNLPNRHGEEPKATWPSRMNEGVGFENGIEIRNLTLCLPKGDILVQALNLTVSPGEAILITGPTGSGKSTLLRAIAGLWPYGSGEIKLGQGKTIFIPQRPYMPLGTLLEALVYPNPINDFSQSRLEEIMNLVGLGNRIKALDSTENWGLCLSLGEQQRISWGRVLLQEPALLFLDEATSALDEQSSLYFYQLVRNASWRPTLMSIGHRTSLLACHDRCVDLGDMRNSRIMDSLEPKASA